jgi:hypothetical protein
MSDTERWLLALTLAAIVVLSVCIAWSFSHPYGFAVALAGMGYGAYRDIHRKLRDQKGE